MDEFAESLKSLNLTQILIAILVALVCMGVSALVDHILIKIYNKSPKRNEKLENIIRKVVRIIVITLSVTAVFDVAGIPTNVVTSLISITAIAVSLAVQGLLTNIVSGSIVIATHPYQVKDLIETDQVKGTVREIGLISTKVERADGAIVTVPNKLMQTGTIINYSKQGRNLIMLDITADYEHSPEEVRRALLYGVSTIKGIIKNPAPAVTVKEYADYGITYTLKVWVPHSDMWDLKFALNEMIYSAFAKYNISIPYPRVEVALREVPPDSRILTLEVPQPQKVQLTKGAKTAAKKK